MTSPKIAFLDRDGVLIEEKDYLSDPEHVVLIPNVVPALQKLRALGYLLVVVSNQSGVARGYFSESDVVAVNTRMRELLRRENVTLNDVLYCPHHPEGTLEPYRQACTCRKPAPGMLIAAARTLHADLGRSIMIGDKLSDIEAGQRAGCAWQALVLTGHGHEVLPEDRATLHVFKDLSSAIQQLEHLTKESLI